MNADYFDRLEAELRAAVPRVAEDSELRIASPAGARAGRRGRTGRPGWLPRVSSASIGLAAAIAVAVVVVVGAIALLGHGRRPVQTATQPPGQATAPARGQYPTLRRLRQDFAVLRRAQTAADRAWSPSSTLRPRGTMPSLTRLARWLPGGARVFVTVIHEPPGGFTPELWLVEPDGATTGATASGPGMNQPTPFQSALPDRTTLWVGLVPDGVDRARWTFECDQPGISCGSHSLAARVHNNVAVGDQPSAWCTVGGACPVVVGATAFGRGDQTVARWPATATPVGVSRVLRGDGIASARFGGRRAAVLAALAPMLGRPTQVNRTRGDCGVDQALSWAGARLATVLSVYVSHGRFVGYQYSGPKVRRSGPGLATAAGLEPGDTVAQARRIYGKAFRLSFAQGGSYSVRTSGGTLIGYLRVTAHNGAIRNKHNQIGTIDAGRVGCPAMTP